MPPLSSPLVPPVPSDVPTPCRRWTFQARLAARELMQIGRQILAALIAEQAAYHDYQTVVTQVQQA